MFGIIVLVKENLFTLEAQFNLLIEQIEGDYYLVYKKALKPWKEKIKVLNQNRLELEHQDKVYIYKRHEKISL